MLRRLLLLCCVSAVPAAAQQALSDSTVVDTVAPGLVHRYFVRQAGPWRMHVVSVALRDHQYVVRAVRALDSLRGRENTTAMVARATVAGRQVRVALNADFFDLKSGESINNQVSDGRIWKALAMSGTPGGAVKTARGQFGMTRDGKPVIDRFVFSGMLRAGRRFWALDGVNAIPSNGEGLVLWLPEANGRPRADSTRHGREVALRVANGSWRDSLLLRVTGRVVAADSAPVPAGFGVLVAYGSTAARLDTIVAARSFSARASWLPTAGPIDQLVGGWPIILRDGASAVEQAVARELTLPGNAAVRHPRSIVGFDADTSHLFVVAIDGRSKASVGMTLVEAAGFLYSLGVTTALNLDGGGSTTLVIDGRIVNVPSDPAGERPVANALLIETRRRP